MTPGTFSVCNAKMPDNYLPIAAETVDSPLVDRAPRSFSLVEIDGVAKSFGSKVALGNISFSVPSGQICGLLGPPGKLMQASLGLPPLGRGFLRSARTISPPS
jgi:ABC-type multidrug transport system fused ATPase/permease subunit